MNDNTTPVSAGINCFQYILTIATQEETLRLISLILSIGSTLIIIVINLVRLWRESPNKGKFWLKVKNLFIKFLSWFKKAKKDGKIESSELEELNDSLQEEKEDSTNE